MFDFVLRSVKEIPHNINKDEFEKVTKQDYPYVQQDNEGKHYYAVCPFCGNPIQIKGLYKRMSDKEGNNLDNTDSKNKQPKPYGAHTGKTIPGLPEYIQENYEYCLYSKKGHRLPKDARKTELTQKERDIYEIIREHFDQAIQVAKKSFGINISDKKAVEILKEYVKSEGYLYPHHTANNIPWMLLYLYSGFNPYKLWVLKGSPLEQKIEQSEEIILEDTDKNHYRMITFKDKKHRFILKVLNHTSNIDDNKLLHEYVTLEISKDIGGTVFEEEHIPEWETIVSVKIPIKESWFMRFVHSDNAEKYRNQNLLNEAKKLMPDI